MSTLVCFHAHPDDEAIGTAGVMARAAAEGHRVVLVVATRGEHGEIVPGVLAPDEQLGIRRTAETYRAAEVLGAHRVEFLGYLDSGMAGTPENDAPGSFWSADVEHAANRLAAILGEEQAHVLTVYDDNGGYGHPDHIQVHRVGRRAAEIAGTPHVFEGTMNRTQLLQAWEAGVFGDGEEVSEPPDMGKPADELTHAVDVTDLVAVKRAAMLAHASQISPEHFMAAMPDEVFTMAFGIEWFIEVGKPRPAGAPFAGSLF